MAEITLKFDAKNTLAKKTLDYILSLGVFTKVSGIEQALNDEKNGKINHYENSKDLFQKVLGK
ncbi:MAG: hypothetical protein KF862_18910 [Chitinophagaceae bacterium]|nr:hypothetical protein [Chitinophagaceae bacterium]